MNISIDSLDAYIQHHIEKKRPPADVLNDYRSRLKGYKFSSLSDADTIDKFVNSVVFIEDRPGYFFLKQSNALKKIGIRSVLLTRWGVNKEVCQSYDLVVQYDHFSDLKLLSGAKACIFYVQSWIGWSFLPVYIDLIVSETVYCNINDLAFLLLEDTQQGIMFGLDKKDVEVDLQCEKYILYNFEKVTLPYCMERLSCMGSYKIKTKGKLILFPCYPSEGYVNNIPRKLSENVHLLFVGGIPIDSLPDRIFSDAKMHNIIDDLLDSGLYVSFFLNPITIDRSPYSIEELYPFFFNLASKNSRFVIQKGYFPWEIYKYTNHFHFGLMVYSFEGVEINQRHIKTILPSKVFTYLELGLPIIVVDELEYVSDFVRSTGVGIVISNEEISCLHKVIERNWNNYETYIDNIKKYCIENNMEQMIHRVFSQSRLELSH